MKKSFMNNLKNFVDSNVRHRIDRVTQNSGNNANNSDQLSDDLLLVERHFDDLRQFCVDTEKRISTMLQSIQISSTAPSQLGAYTQNVQAGFNSLSHNLAQQAANITSSTSSNVGGSNYLGTNMIAKSNDCKISSLSSLESSTSPDNRSGYVPLVNDNQNVISAQVNQEFYIDLPTELNYDTLQKFKKLPIVGLYKSLCKSGDRMKQDSLLATTLAHCSRMQAQLTNLYLIYEQMIDAQCLKPIQQMLETDIPNVQKLKKLYIRAQGDFESIKTKYNGASQKQQQQLQSGNSTNTSYLVSQSSTQQSNIYKLEMLKNELDESILRFDQARDIYEAELFTFVCREPELVDLLRLFYQLQSGFHQRMIGIIQSSMPTIDLALDRTPRKFVFGTPLCEHVRSTGRKISPVIELCVHFLHSQGLQEEGLFRIPGSSVKIKKLKNGINALFLTLMSLSELESDQQRRDGHSCIVSMHDLFKSAVGQRPQNEQQPEFPSQSTVLKSSSAIDESTTCHANYSASNVAQHESNNNYIMDVHSIAGLLKLYLRELPEPLFTHALYDSWVDCVGNKTESNQKRLELFAKVISQLPSANYANLGHLIKFLSRLAHFHEQNKMTSTNLAIAMAPSLIWPKPTNEVQPRNDTTLNTDGAQTLNQQMCSFGLSASQHAMILEALINNAEVLFPERSDFELSEFSNLNLKATLPKRGGSTRGRTVKSTSPTGLSTASSSSFSSNASNSTGANTLMKGHSRKGGSMEGLLAGNGPDVKVALQPNMSTRSIGRPVSVQMRREDYTSMIRQDNLITSSATQATKPPVPTARAHSRNTGDVRTIHNPLHKPPAPPVPPPTSVRHQQERLKLHAASIQTALCDQTVHKPRPVSLRGTGTVDQSNSSNQVKTRPSVPPPDRPATATLIGKDCEGGLEPRDMCKSVDDIDTKSATSLTSSGSNLRTDYEEINPSEVEDIEVAAQSSSPVLSLDGVLANDDSSFDESDDDNVSLDPSWTKCFSDHAPAVSAGRLEDSGTLRRTDADHQTPSNSANEADERRGDSAQRTMHHTVVQAEVGQVAAKKPAANITKPPPPAKPLRSASPKLTQSTPL